MKNYRIKPNIYNSAILLHKQEGRLLLIGDNGLYNDLVISIIKETRKFLDIAYKYILFKGGNFLFIVTNLNDTNETDIKQANLPRIKEILCNVKKIETLSKKGGQPFLSILANQLMMITLEEENEMHYEQMDFICSFLHKSIYKSLIPENFLKFDETLEQEFTYFDPITQRIALLDEIKKQELINKNEKILNFINDELNQTKNIENTNSFCVIF